MKSAFSGFNCQSRDKVKRHKRLTEALKSRGVKIVEGKFKKKERVIRISNQLSLTYKTHEEKQTDVNIALHLLQSAMNDDYDTAMIVTNDTDLVPAIRAIKQNFPGKRIEVIFPLDSYSKELDVLCDSHKRIKEMHLKTCQLPDTVVDATTGITVRCPDSWK